MHASAARCLVPQHGNSARCSCGSFSPIASPAAAKAGKCIFVERLCKLQHAAEKPSHDNGKVKLASLRDGMGTLHTQVQHPKLRPSSAPVPDTSVLSVLG